ncbi:MAG: D-alanine--D-alanine ligase [Oscillospiraceae bacterium]|jgi:D-alanine-D-alanine ligase|nr:D-alanine--D-alanine ligase [Oscillospiraceae bacterium]
MKISIGLFFGGKSVEHEVSIISALQALRNFDANKYDVTPVYIARNGYFYVGEKLRNIADFRDIPSLLTECRRVIPTATESNRVELHGFPFTARLFGKSSKALATIDIAFPIVHGTNVEDGALQGYLQTLGLPIAGPGVCAAALGMDKYVQKALYRAAGLPVLNAVKFTAREFGLNQSAVSAQIESEVGYPLVVKPLNLGSSIGVKLANDRAELESAIEFAAEFCPVLLAEKAAVNPREINCAVLGDRDFAKASECEEPLGLGDILSYDDKYSVGAKDGTKGMASLKRLLPAPITPEQRTRIQDYAVRAFQTLDCSGTARVDFLIDGVTEEIRVNEINTIPGSLSFYLWEASGIKYPALLDEMVTLALKRARETAEHSYEIKTGILSAFTGGSKTGKLKG